ncbi:MAG: LamG domain-containing protein [Lentisphaerae bacterium]|nr:LamG domain-containing protein [Lentisphaerota bacterium]
MDLSFMVRIICVVTCCWMIFPLGAVDWYTSYQHTDNGLTAALDFNGSDILRIRDRIVQKNAIGSDVVSIPGWQPESHIPLDGKGRAIQDIANVAERKDFTIVFHGKVIGSGYALLKKGSFGLLFNDEKVSVYLHGGKGDMAFSAGVNDQRFHTWAFTVKGNAAAAYCDGKLVGKRTLPTPVACSKEKLLIGNSGGWKKSSVTGSMGLLRIYSQALSAEDIAAMSIDLGRGNVPPPAASLELQLPMGAQNVFAGDDISYEKKALAWYFNGSSSSIKLPDYPELEKPLANLTAGAWIKPERTMPKSLDEQGHIISAKSSRNSGWAIGTYYKNGLNVSLRTDQGYFTCSAYEVLKPGCWQHVAFVYDGEKIQIFVNGQPVGQSVAAQGKILPYKGRIHVGKAADRDGLFFQGGIDDVRIYRTAIALKSDPDTGKLITVKATNSDPTALAEPLPRLRDMEKQVPIGKVICDFEDLSNWNITTCKNIAEGTLCRSNDDRLWGDYTAKLTLQAGIHFDPARRRVSIAPDVPIEIREEFDYLSMYISAANWTKTVGTKLEIELIDADGKRVNVPMQSAEIPFIYWTGWTVMIKKIPQPVKVPAKLTKLTFYDFGGLKPEVYYLDNLAVHKLAPELPAAGVKIPSWQDIGAPTVSSGARPTLQNAAEPGRVEKQGKSYNFIMGDSKDKIVCNYTPASGSLSDITLSFNGGKPFQPLLNGGFCFVAPDGNLLDANAAGLTAELLDCRQTDGKVITRWSWSYKNQALAQTVIELSANGKTLSIKLSGGNGKVYEVRTGLVAGLTDKAVISPVPYWVVRAKKINDPAILYCNKMVMSAFVDIYYSNASSLIGGHGALADNRYQINGGAVYQAKTDGQRNTVSEVIHLTASSTVAEVLPHIANPRNPTMELTRQGIWATRMWYDKMPLPDYFPRHYKMWEMFHRYGMRNLMIRDHQSLGRQYSPKRRGGYDSNLESILPDIGGDAAAAEYFRKCTDLLGYRMGLYSNYTLLPAIGSCETTFDRMTLNSDGDIRYGATTARMCKYAYMLDIQQRINALLKRKFKLTCTYPDQYTCRAPWAYTDLDARAPEAGKFSPVIRVLAKSLIVERKDFDIPLSEGIMQWVLAGFCDSYSQSGSPDDPVYPEFQLRKIHPLSNDTGCHLSIAFSRNKKEIDRMLTLTFAHGNIGHLFGITGGKPQVKAEAVTLKSYFMPKQIQKYYAGVPVADIKYHLDGRMLSAAELLAADALNNNQLKITYNNGCTVYINANKNKEYALEVKGRKITLPPYGYYLNIPDKCETYSILNNSVRADYSLGDEYCYVNGNGQENDFGAVKCRNAYAILFEDKGKKLEVIPAPFVKAEKITVDLSCLPLKQATAIIGLDENRKEVFRRELPQECKKLELNIDGKVFSYMII